MSTGHAKKNIHKKQKAAPKKRTDVKKKPVADGKKAKQPKKKGGKPKRSTVNGSNDEKSSETNKENKSSDEKATKKREDVKLWIEGLEKPAKKTAIPKMKKINSSSNSSEASQDKKTGSYSTDKSQEPWIGRRTSQEAHPDACVICRDAACLRLLLRNCDHIVCVACLLGYLQGQIALKAKVGIRCPNGRCAREIHDNDIRAVFDKKEAGLDVFMKPERRQWLQYCHDKDSIVLGLAGSNWKEQEQLTRRCPLCKNIYYKREGCNNVVCPNLRCRTNFCWTCGRPIRGIGHFTGGQCRVSYEDITRGFVILFLIKSITKSAFILSYPAAFLLFHVYMPMSIFFACPYYAARHFYLSATQLTDFLTPAEWFLLAIKMVLAAIGGIFIGLPIAIGSIFTGSCLFILYNGIVMLKFCGLLEMLTEKYDRLLPFANLLGLGHVKLMLKEGREEKRREKERRQAEEARDHEADASVVSQLQEKTTGTADGIP